VVQGGIRLIFGMALVWAGLGTIGALSAQILAVGAVAVLGFIVLRGIFKTLNDDPTPAPHLFGSFIKNYYIFVGYSVLAFADPVLAKHYLDPHHAGTFAKAAMLARVVMFLPQPVFAAMFSKVISCGEEDLTNERTLKRTLVLVVFLVFATAVICSLLAPAVVNVLSGSADFEQTAILWAMLWAYSPLPVLMLLLNGAWAQKRYAAGAPLLVGAGMYLLGVWKWHADGFQIAMVLGVASTLTLLASSLLVFSGRRGRR
jgi:O-antigen/teichoic acid export membrane protein